MPAASKHILIVNYDFPPNQGIGGRRWAKFAKELAARNYVVHVIKADPTPGNKSSGWTTDVSSSGIRVHSLPRRYPIAFSHPGADLLSKVKYRIARWNLSRQEKGTIYDIAIGWERDFLEKASEIVVANRIQNIIASGAPWYLLVYAAKVKQQFPDINFIADFRDPWLNAKNYGMANLSPERKRAEEEKFHFAMRQANAVVAPNAEMIRDLKSMCGSESAIRFEVLGHSYDPDDIPTPASRNDQNTIRLVYGGDLYLGLEKQLEVLRSQILTIQTDYPEIYRKLSITVFTNSPAPASLQGIEKLEVKPAIGKALFDELNQADYCMIMLTDSKRNEPTTKFREFLPLRKPLLVLAPEGDITALVRREKLGVVVDPMNPKSLGELLTNPPQFNASYDIRPYSLQAVTDQLCELLK